MNIVPELSISTKEVNALDSLITRIDKKLIQLSAKAYESVAYGMGHANVDKAEDLINYRDILIQKKNGCGCYKAYSLNQIISKIKTLTA